ncbi:MAG: glutamine--fructose-6-phosphate transaminase (isomerizing) [Patescibacteria group bacterium]
MCGIVGYIGNKNAVPVLLEGLKRLEYRGYDSAGFAVLKDGAILVRKKPGKVATLEKLVAGEDLKSNLGIAHTRWATHGEPNEINAHPHTDCSGRIALVHNGIIENHNVLKDYLKNKKHIFRSETDTEVVAHLIEEFLKKENRDFLEAFIETLKVIKGSYALAVIDAQNPEVIYAVRYSSPLVIGQGASENFIASDASPFVGRTKKIIYPEENQIIVVGRDKLRIFDINRQEKDILVKDLETNLESIQKGDFPHFMLKEIYEQPDTILDTMRGRLLVEEGKVKLGGLENIKDKIFNAQRIIIIACGTSWHSALAGKYMIEELARVPVEVEYASEFRYRNPIILPTDVFVFISQSGETADTLAALKEAKKRNAAVLGIVNVVGSTIAREAGAGIYIHAGPEIGVASTKAFTSQLVALALFTIFLAREKGLSKETGQKIIEELATLPVKARRILNNSEPIKKLASLFKESCNFLYLGRGANFPTALEGALKLKEISYIHAEGYPAAEMKHGPIALVDEKMPVVFIVPKDGIYEKVLSNIQEVKARRGIVIAVANEDDEDIKKIVDFVLPVPRTLSFFGPILNIIPLQLLAYYIASERGCQIDQPRNLAKSVTVE